jgi:hypothetical protein
VELFAFAALLAAAGTGTGEETTGPRRIHDTLYAVGYATGGNGTRAKPYVGWEQAFDDMRPGWRLTFDAGYFATSRQLTLAPGATYEGTGPAPTPQPPAHPGTIIDSTFAGFAMFYQTPKGTGRFQGPVIRNLKLYANSGIQLNSQRGGFTKDGTTQSPVFQPLIEGCVIEAREPGTGTGIEWSRVFDGVITRSRIESFSIGIDFYGSDINAITHNRVRGDTTGVGKERGLTLIRTRSDSNFGSQTYIAHNDLLHLPDHPGAQAFVILGDKRPLFLYNYIEEIGSYPKKVNKKPVLQVIAADANHSMILIEGNTIGVDTEQTNCWLDLHTNDSDPAAQDFLGLLVSDNYVGKNLWPPTCVNGVTTNRRISYRQSTAYNKIVSVRNTRWDTLPLIADVPQPVLPLGSLVISPRTDVELTGNHARGLDVEMSGNISYFVLSSMPETTGQVKLGSRVGTTVGTFNVYMVAKSNVAGTVLHAAWRSDPQGPNSGVEDLTLTTEWRQYRLFGGMVNPAVNLQILLWNNTKNAGEAHVAYIVAEPHGDTAHPGDVYVYGDRLTLGDGTDRNLVVAFDGAGTDATLGWDPKDDEIEFSTNIRVNGVVRTVGPQCASWLHLRLDPDESGKIYGSFNPGTAADASEAKVDDTTVPAPLTFHSLRVDVDRAPDRGAGAQSWTVTLRGDGKEVGSPKPLGCVISEAEVGCSDSQDAAVLPSGTKIAVSVVGKNAPADESEMRISVCTSP